MWGRAMLGVALSALAAGPAQAQQYGFRDYALRVESGTMTLRFQGDLAAGCAQRGVCGTSGTVRSTTGPSRGSGMLDAFGGGFSGHAAGPANGKTIATVSTVGAPDCTDTVPRVAHQFTFLAARTGPLHAGYGSTLSVESDSGNESSGVGWSPGEGQPQNDRVFETRCPGPLMEDFAMAWARTGLPRAALRRRTITVALVAERPFSGGGFAGTLTTDLRLTLTRKRCPERFREHCRVFDRRVRAIGA